MQESISILEAAIQSGHALDEQTHGDLLTMCHNDHNVPYSQSMMVWLWGFKLLPMVSQSIWILVLISGMDRPKENESWVVSGDDGKQIGMVRMGLGAKLFVMLTVDIPRLFVALYLYWMGAKFLMYAKNLGVLIMKSIGLSFIATFPEVIYAGGFSESFQKELAKVRLNFFEGDNQEQDDNKQRTWLDNWNLWGASITKIFGVLICTLYYCRVLFGDLQELRESCISYKYKFYLPDCPRCGSEFLGFKLLN